MMKYDANGIKQVLGTIILCVLAFCAYSQNVGIQTDTPDSTLSIANKVEIGGARGDIVLTDDQASIRFPDSQLPNSPMVYMFNQSGSNADRMVLAHSPVLDDWGLQFKDGKEEFHFIAGGNHAMSLDLNTAGSRLALAEAALHKDYTFNLKSSVDLRTLHIINEIAEPTESSYGVYATNMSDGSFPKYGGNFRATGANGQNIGLRAFASGGSEGNTALVAEAYGANRICADFASGNVLVNDSMVIGGDIGASGYRLSVDGKIIGEELRIEISQLWPDYVFEDDYELMTLEELEQSIKSAGHLPGIPSAAAIESGGLMVGDMQKRMMEKIEELTLHVIALNKKNKELESQMETLIELTKSTRK